MKFEEMNIDKRILDALSDMKFSLPTEIQAKTMPACLQGRDVIGQSMTGSGKTAAFAVPIIQHIISKGGHGVEALVLVPTRELCLQITEEMRKFAKYCKVNVAEVYGGVSIENQISSIRHASIVVGTPGRILDHMRRGTLSLKAVKILVLVEADRMLDMGFIDDIRMIINQTPKERQTLLFSATMPEEIASLAHKYMRNAVRMVTEKHVEKHRLKQFYYDVKNDEKLSVLMHLIEKEKPSLALIFCATRSRTDFVSRNLHKNGFQARAIHGGLTQNTRTNVLAGFEEGRPRLLVATDVAARGLDVQNISHIFNYDIPKNFDDYTHRIGRTARLGKEGKAISLLSSEDHETFRHIVRDADIEKCSLENFVPRRIRVYTDERQFRREPRNNRRRYR
mgnify:FL=1